MKRYVLAGVCAFACALMGVPAFAQSPEVKEKPPMYTYVSNWAIPRAQWGEMDKGNAANQKVLEKALANGTLVGYGEDVNLVHELDGMTHDDWWSSMSMAGVINVLEQFYQTGASTTTVLGTATKHYDSLWVSKYYNWHPGTFKNGYTHVGVYKLKADAPDDAVATLSKTMLVPFFEKLVADGTIHQYEIDTQALHTTAPGTFALVYITANAEGLDKVDAALTDTLKSNPLISPAFGSMVDFTAHRDSLARTTGTYK